MRTVAAGSSHQGVAAGGDSLWVASFGTDAALELDPETGALRRTSCARGGQPPGRAGAAGKTLWVANSGGASISRIDTESGEVTATVKAGVGPRGIAVLEDAAWVANTVSGNVARVEEP